MARDWFAAHLEETGGPLFPLQSVAEEDPAEAAVGLPRGPVHATKEYRDQVLQAERVRAPFLPAAVSTCLLRRR